MRIFLLGLINLLFHVQAQDGTGLTGDERAQFDAQAEKHEFKSEVNRAMEIIIHSLYSERQIFLRELISNAADASDKLRHLSLTNPSLLKEGEVLDIKIVADEAKKTLTITDRGIGMTKEQLVSNLGIVAKSGTTEFVAAAEKDGANKLSLIGQFGVGFYSAYLVADKVTVISKSDDSDVQYIWESNAQGQFTVAPDPRGNTLGRGTSITLHLKEDAEEFLKPDELTKIVQQYSQFITFPIMLQKTKQVEREVPIEEEVTPPTPKGDDDLEVSEDEGEGEEEKPKTKKITETVTEFEHLNKAKPLWTRPPKEVTEQEYKDFFNALTKDSSPDGYLDKLHFSTEGDSPFKALLFIPKKSDTSVHNELFSLKKSNVALYVRRVLIADQFEDFLPRYMNFIRGIVEADNVPLNVSRETLAQMSALQTMAKKIVKKVLDLLTRMAEGSSAEKKTEGGDASGEQSEGEKSEVNSESLANYEAFWKEYGKSIKFGIMDDRKNKAKLVRLLRFRTSTSEGKEVSLESYVSRMKEGQKRIYFMTGESDEKIKKSPFLEKVTEKGYEVIFMSDPLDEYVVGAVTEFEGVALQSVTKENLKLDEEESEQLKKDKETFKPLTEWFTKVYGDKVEKVVVSNRLGSSPCVLVTGQYGMSANMQRIVKGSTLQSHGPINTRKTLEINVHHPILKAINDKIENHADDESLVDMANILLDSALVTSGFTISDYSPFYQRMTKVISAGLGLDPEAKATEEIPDGPEEEGEGEGEEEVEPVVREKPKRKVEEEDAHDEL